MSADVTGFTCTDKFNTNAEEYFFKFEEFVVVVIGKDLAPNTLTLHLVVFTY